MSDLARAALTLLAVWTDEVWSDLWHWFLTNFNLIAIVGAFRMWSMREHRQTAKKLDEERAALAEQIAAVARNTAERAQTATAGLSAAIAENTEISTKAFHEANKVNEKIASIGAEQVALATQQNDMQQAREDEKKDDDDHDE